MEDTTPARKTRVERSNVGSTRSSSVSGTNSKNETTTENDPKRKMSRKESNTSVDQSDDVDGIFVDRINRTVAETSLTQPVSMLAEGETTELFVQHELQDNHYGDKLNGKIMTTTETVYTVHLFKYLETSDTAILYSKLGIREDDYLISLDGNLISFAIPRVEHADVVNLFKNLPMDTEHEMVILRRSESLYHRISFVFRGVVGNPIEKTVVGTLGQYVYVATIIIECPMLKNEFLPKSLRYTGDEITCAIQTANTPLHEFHFKTTRVHNAGEEQSFWQNLNPEIDQMKYLAVSGSQLSLVRMPNDSVLKNIILQCLDMKQKYQIKIKDQGATKYLSYVNGNIRLIGGNVEENDKESTVFTLHRMNCSN